MDDKWSWLLSPDGCFSVKSVYEELFKEIVAGPILGVLEENVFKNIWDSPAPSKIIVFSWQLLYDRVPTKDNLLLRGIILPNGGTHCAWCGQFPEYACHLFLHCKVAFSVWYAIFKWLGVVIVMPANLFYLFDCLSGAVASIKAKNKFKLVWHTVIWSIWKALNNKIFKNIDVQPVDIVEEVKVLSRKWSAERLKISPCLFYEWTWDPGSCFNR
jgi:hypothetical protein